MVRAAVLWVVLSLAYLLFAGGASLTEAAAGLPALTAATIFAVILRRGARRQFRLHASWPRVVLRVLASLVMDSVRVGIAIVRGAPGRVAKQPFRIGGDTPAEAGRRAIVTLAASVAPNGYVLALPAEQDTLLLHRLVAVPPRLDRDWPA